MTILIIISILILFITGLLVLPVRIVIQTNNNRYFAEIPFYIKAQLIYENNLFLKLRVFYIPINIKTGKSKDDSESTEDKTANKKRRRRKMKPGRFFEMLLQIVYAFKVKKMFIDVDTGNFPLNAQLVPVTYALNKRNINVNINFENRNYADIEIYTRLYKMIWIGIKNFLLNF